MASLGRSAGAISGSSLQVTLEDAARGAERPITIAREETCSACFGTGAEKGSAPEPCPTCHGAGQVRHSRRTPFGQFAQIATCPQCRGAGKIIRKPCRDCRGSGRVRAQREIAIKVPAGIEDGTRLRVYGEGEAGMRGGTRGDLYVDLRIAEHPVFTRDGPDLHCDVTISMIQAALGAEIEAPTLDGPTPLTVPPGTQPGAVLTLRGKGMPGLRGGRGDLAVHLAVTVPRELTKEQVKMLAQFAKLRGEQITAREEDAPRQDAHAPRVRAGRHGGRAAGRRPRDGADVGRDHRGRLRRGRRGGQRDLAGAALRRLRRGTAHAGSLSLPLLPSAVSAPRG